MNPQIARREHEDVVRRNVPVLFQVVQVFDDLDHHQRLAAAGRHPKAHAVDEVVIRDDVVLWRHVFSEDVEDGVLFQVFPVGVVFISPDRKLGRLVSVTVGGEVLLAPTACFGRLGGLPGVVLAVVEIQGPRCVFQRIDLIVVEGLLQRETLNLRDTPSFRQVAVVEGLSDRFKNGLRHGSTRENHWSFFLPRRSRMVRANVRKSL